MIIVNVIGGLGNQMFQYAFGYGLSQKTSDVLKLDINDFVHYEDRKYELDLYNCDATLATADEIQALKYPPPSKKKNKEHLFIKVIRKLRKKPAVYVNMHYQETQHLFDDNVCNIRGDIYFSGYWQSEKYFKTYRGDLLKQFTLKKEINIKTKAYQHLMGKTEAISLHIRRGDYIADIKINSVHGVCDINYYKNAVAFLKDKVANPHFFIFSDDLDWAKNNLNFIDNKTFIELDENIPDHEEMHLMSQCEHNIIANSSFSWWGAWLNQNAEKIVIAPKKWFQSIATDIVPDSWVHL